MLDSKPYWSTTRNGRSVRIIHQVAREIFPNKHSGFFIGVLGKARSQRRHNAGLNSSGCLYAKNTKDATFTSRHAAIRLIYELIHRRPHTKASRMARVE